MIDEHRKSGVVALIGRPNAGKSTLLNRVIGEKIAIVSDKPQTTRTRITGVLTRPDGQIVFLDTPGVHKPGYKLNRRMMAVVTDALSTVDLILLLIDATKPMGHGDQFVLEMLRRVETRAFLLPNKVDALRDKTRLLTLIGRYTSEREFAEVIPISALTGDGADLLIGKIFECLPAGPMLYPEDEMTDQPERVLAAELVREKILQVTGEELPYVTAVVTERWEDAQGITKIHCLIYVERPSHRAIVIGKAGARLKEIGTAARADIEKLLDRRVFLNLFVKVRERWRDDERALDELGIRLRLPIARCRLPIADCPLHGSQPPVDNPQSTIGNRQRAIGNRQPTMDDRQSPIGNSHWGLVTLCVSRDAEENASALLFDLGSTGIVTLDESADNIKLGAYFHEETNVDDIKQTVEAEFARAGRRDAIISFSMSTVPDQDWMQKWKEGFEAVEIGNRLVVAPSWKLPTKRDGQVLIQIDPGMAFGTGTHETTRLCLQGIERYWHGGSLLDVGTGTGILAIAAALLAPDSRVVAIDVDPQAVEVARENIAINNVSSSIELLEGQPRNLAGQQFNIAVANLTAEVIVDLLPDLTSCLATQGLMILSGILSESAEQVERTLAAYGLRVTQRRDAGEWCMLVAVKS